ncbi:MAG TPA: efflux RND transporter periplasmic adaptor subunit [Burkholderiaceae bacterium]|nr:efflux RND transporter periplasmic adaptor subunit [Burkholderiaceae bacterium]
MTPTRTAAYAAAFALAVGAGYWIGSGKAIFPATGPSALAQSAQAAGSTAAPVDGPTPGSAAAGSEGAAGGGSTPGGERRILYYRNPMGLPDTSPVPKKDPMGMDYIPVYADDSPNDTGVVVVSPARVQTLGVRTALVEERPLEATVRASGRVEVDERSQVDVAPRFDGWIERLHVSAVGDKVRKGQPLFSTYSPELQSAGEELRIAERLARDSEGNDAVANDSARRLAEATRGRLRNLQVAGQTSARQTFRAPANGVVLEKPAIQGARFEAGETLFRIADLSRVWIIADVYERDLGRVSVGQPAWVSLDAFPGRRFEARVAYRYPTLNAATRSTPVRLELDNREGLLQPGMFAQVEMEVGGSAPRTTVPSSAIIDDGQRQVVLLALAEGRFQPRAVRLGERGVDAIEVLEGLEPGDRVVVSANFLIDSESQLRAALANLTDSGTGQTDSDTRAGGAQPGEGATHRAQGSFDAIDRATGSATITHGEIASLKWPAMTMDFMLADPALADGIAPGTAVRFEFREGAPGEFVITRIERQPAGSASGAHGHEGH